MTPSKLIDLSDAEALLAQIRDELGGSLAVTGPLTDAQLRAAAVAIQAASLPLPAGASTAARQDTGNTSLATLAAKNFATEGTLSALSGKLGTPSADDLLSLLRDIKVNTSEAATTVDTLSLTADQVQLNTDQVEAKLDTVSARLGTTGSAGTVAALLDAIRQQTVAPDISDRAARLLGHVSVDSLPNVTLTNPFNGDVTDRSARLLGHVTVDNLPTGASTEATLSTLAGKDFATDAHLAALLALIPTALGTGGGLKTAMVTALAGEDFTNSLFAVHAKPHASPGYNSQLYQSLAAVTKASIKVGPGNLYAVRITNDNAAARYFQLHNKTTAPVAGDTPQMVLKVPGGTAANPGTLTLDRAFFAEVEAFTLGIAWAVSTTLTTFTDAATASEHLATLRYV